VRLPELHRLTYKGVAYAALGAVSRKRQAKRASTNDKQVGFLARVGVLCHYCAPSLRGDCIRLGKDIARGPTEASSPVGEEICLRERASCEMVAYPVCTLVNNGKDRFFEFLDALIEGRNAKSFSWSTTCACITRSE
jgi:hypothetical protein